MSRSTTPAEMAATFARVTGQRARHEPTTAEEFGELTASMVGPPFREDATQMMRWAAETPRDRVAYGAEDPRALEDAADELGGLVASSFEEWLLRTGWTGPGRT